MTHPLAEQWRRSYVGHPLGDRMAAELDQLAAIVERLRTVVKAAKKVRALQALYDAPIEDESEDLDSDGVDHVTRAQNMIEAENALDATLADLEPAVVDPRVDERSDAK